ncbi:MAG: hypothetical protein GF308_00955 [Candidatus Heimdallarchaeota archaeon]|nr:hypothetical protein [Candidatus Heimdallarchaeota archaeon]
MIIKKKYSLLGAILLLSLFFCQTSPITAMTFPFTDAGNDVVYILNSIQQDEGDYHDEIDIVKIALVGTNIEIEFQDTPVIDGYHEYVMMIIWDEESSGNSTSIAAGNMLGQEPLNFVSTLLLNSSGIPVAYSNIEDLITISGNKLVAPLLNYSLIQDPQNPFELHLTTHYDTGATTETWWDYFPDSTNSFTSTDNETNSLPFPSLPIGLSIIALSTPTIITIIYQRKKK